MTQYDAWIMRETDVLNRLHRYVSDTVRTVAERNDGYDSLDLLLDVLYATVVTELKEYFENEYDKSYSEGIDGRLEVEPDKARQYEAVYAEVDGKNFEDRVQEYIDTMYADLLLTDDYSGASDKLVNSLDVLTKTDGHRVRSEGTLGAGNTLQSVGYRCEKVWHTQLDPKVRDPHARLEGESVPYDGKFSVDGFTASAPGLFGVAELDVNCRCWISLRAELSEEV